MKLKSVHPALVALACALPACDSTNEDVATDKADIAAEAEAGGKADQVDICAGWDWYDDDFCDDPYGWCAQPDPDCGPDGESCAPGWTWSGRANEGCVEERAPVGPLTFSEPAVIGRRPSTAFDMRGWASVAVDDAGDVHVVYADTYRHPTYATATDGWTPRVLDPNAYVQEGLAIAANHEVHVAYVDDHYELQHLLLDDAAVVDQASAGTYIYSLAMDLAEDEAHFVFGSGDLTNRLAARSGTFGDEVTREIIELDNVTEAPESPAIVIADGLVHAVYGTQPAAYNLHAGPQLRYAVRDASGTWADQVVAGGTRDGGAVAVAADGEVVAVYRGFVDGQQTLMFASRVNGTWTSAPLLGMGIFGASPNVVATEDGKLHVVYRGSGSVVRYVERDGEGTWGEPIALDPQASMSSSDRIGLATAPDGAVHVVYSDTQTREVRYVVGRR